MSKIALTINCGSSSLKYALFDGGAGAERPLERGTHDGIEDQVSAVRSVLRDLSVRNMRPDVVGHRIVHGGPSLSAPTRVDTEVLKTLDASVRFAPLHLPIEIAAVRAVETQWPGMMQVASFDTAFHHAMPDVAKRYALPTSLPFEGIRRYGFHGLSYESIVSTLGSAILPRTIVAHLGSGASLAAVEKGTSVDTTMGFSPTSGLIMGTRSGDLDPGLVTYLASHGMHASAIERMIQHESGMFALSETSADVRKLLAARASDPRAAFAIEAFCMSVRKGIGAMTAVLGGVDALIFTGGIGENSPEVRAECVEGLAHLGIEIDPSLNERRPCGVIGRGSCNVRVIATDEERMVARHALAALV